MEPERGGRVVSDAISRPEPLPPSPPATKGGILPFLAIGAGIGLIAAFAQIRLFRFGGLASEQIPLFWAFFVAAGVLLTAGVGWLLRFLLLARGLRRPVLAGCAGFATALFFLVFVPLNLRPMPDVFLLVTDATRADHLSLYGYERETTPFLEELREESVVFRNMVSQGSHTIVTTPCILSSCYPSEHGLVDYGYVLSPHFTLLGEYLRDKGYRTFGYATNPHLGPANGFDQGFEMYEHDPDWAHTPAGDVNRKLIAWIDGERRRPMFGFLFYIDPHNPYIAPPKFQKLFDPEWPGKPTSDWYQGPNNKPDPRTLFNLIAQYDGSIAYWDSELRILVGALRDRGIFDDAILVYTADHGEEFWEHGNWGHNRTLFEESIHVPLLVSLPVPFRFPPLGRSSRTVDGVASSVDIVPTVLDYLRIQPDPSARGRSLVPLALGRREKGPERRAYLEQILDRYGPYDLRGLRTERYKYVMTFNYEGKEDVPDAFYDLQEDPGEKRGSVPEQGEVAVMHGALLRSLIEENSAAKPTRVDTVGIDEATRERLRALGYIHD
jgi:arylsulfatase